MYRIIYSLKFDLQASLDGELRQLIVPLQYDGNAKYVEQESGDKRVIDLRSGDDFLYRGKREQVVRIAASGLRISAEECLELRERQGVALYEVARDLVPRVLCRRAENKMVPSPRSTNGYLRSRLDDQDAGRRYHESSIIADDSAGGYPD